MCLLKHSQTTPAVETFTDNICAIFYFLNNIGMSLIGLHVKKCTKFSHFPSNIEFIYPIIYISYYLYILLFIYPIIYISYYLYILLFIYPIIYSEPLMAYIDPSTLTVDIGGSALFRCVSTGYPITSLRWFKDGQPLSLNSRLTVSSNSSLLHIGQVERKDAGMYQCLVANENENGQGSAQLSSGGMATNLCSQAPNCYYLFHKFQCKYIECNNERIMFILSSTFIFLIYFHSLVVAPRLNPNFFST